MARFEIGEVLLTTSIGDVLRQLSGAIVPCNPSLSHQLAEGHSIHLPECHRGHRCITGLVIAPAEVARSD
jgi:hypothetical protein